MKMNQLVVLFKALKGSGKSILYADLLRKGYSSPLIDKAAELVGVVYDSGQDTRTIIRF